MNNKDIPINWERSRILEATPGTQNKNQSFFFFFFHYLTLVHRFKLLLKVIDKATLSQAFYESLSLHKQNLLLFFFYYFLFLFS